MGQSAISRMRKHALGYGVPSAVLLLFALLTVRVSQSADIAALSTLLFWAYIAVVSLGLGDALLSVARVRISGGITRFALTWAAGYTVAALASAVAVYAVDPLVTFWVLLGCAVAWIGWRVRAIARDGCADDAPGLVGGAALAAILAAVASAGSRLFTYVSTAIEPTVRFVQHIDVLFHVAVTKEILGHGFPLTTSPFMAGVPWHSYHATFDALSATLSAGVGIDPLHAVVGLCIPASFVTVMLAAAALAGVWVRGVAAPLATVGVMLVALIAGSAPAVWFGQAEYGSYQIVYFLFNPPAALGAAAVLAGIAVLASVGRDRLPGRTAVAAAALVTCSTAMKANTALVFVPAVALTLTVMMLRKRLSGRGWFAVMGVMGALGLTGLFLVRGMSTELGVRYGMFAEWLRTESLTTPVLAQLTEPLGELGGLGAVYIVLIFLVLGVLGGRLAVALLFGAMSTTVRDGWRAWIAEHGSSVLVVLGAFVLMVGIALTLVHVDTGRSEAWNVAGHALPALYWLGVAFAGASIALLLERVAERRSTAALAALLLLALAFIAIPARISMRDAREAGYSQVSTDLQSVLGELESRTPADAVVVQNFDIEINEWVAGYGGRRVVLERGSTWVDYYPEYAVRRRQLVKRLYAAVTEEKARAYASELGADYAIVDTGDPTALWAIGEPVVQHGDWALLHLALD